MGMTNFPPLIMSNTIDFGDVVQPSSIRRIDVQNTSRLLSNCCTSNRKGDDTLDTIAQHVCATYSDPGSLIIISIIARIGFIALGVNTRRPRLGKSSAALAGNQMAERKSLRRSFLFLGHLLRTTPMGFVPLIGPAKRKSGAVSPSSLDMRG